MRQNNDSPLLNIAVLHLRKLGSTSGGCHESQGAVFAAFGGDDTVVVGACSRAGLILAQSVAVTVFTEERLAPFSSKRHQESSLRFVPEELLR